MFSDTICTFISKGNLSDSESSDYHMISANLLKNKEFLKKKSGPTNAQDLKKIN